MANDCSIRKNWGELTDEERSLGKKLIRKQLIVEAFENEGDGPETVPEGEEDFYAPEALYFYENGELCYEM